MDPILRVVNFTEDRVEHMLKIKGGLHRLGNQKPYFSVTADLFEAGRRCGWSWVSGGAQHDLILKHAPDFRPLVEMHLASIDGKPMYAIENGRYWLAGAIGGTDPMGMRYHGGNGNSAHTPEECMKIFCELERCAPEVGEEIKKRYLAGERNILSEYVVGQRDRWLSEARKVIADFHLTVYGDNEGRSDPADWLTEGVQDSKPVV